MKLRPRPSHEGVSVAAVGSSRKTKARVQKPRSKKARSTQITHLKKDAVALMVADTEENSNTKSSKRTSSTASHEEIELSALTKQEMIAIQILAVDFPSGYIGIQLPEILSATIPGLNLSSPTAKRTQKQLKSKDFSSLERLLKPEGNESEKDPGLQSSIRQRNIKPHTRPTRPSAKSTRLEVDPKKQSEPKLNDPTSTRRRGCGTAYRECIICATSKPLGHNGANFPKFEQCSHEPLTCTDCVAKHITIILESQKPLVPENVDSMRKIAAAVWSLCSCPQCARSSPSKPASKAPAGSLVSPRPATQASSIP
ncbi:hypothetical protein VTN00DRAFT_10409 [Thermoascus crustaceus]|uniref:uncharacterized protein n=1 Tax=Thermoascus crustaceus TaxID=5088 RepID=UPI003743D473